MDASGGLDDVRYEHHVRHRGQTNHRIFWVIWFGLTAIIFGRFFQRAHGWWSRRSHRKHRYVRLHSRKRARCIDRASAFVKALFVLPISDIAGLKTIDLPLGKCIAIIALITTIPTLLTSVDAPFLSSHYVDDMAFRAAWVTLSQIPIIYLLSTKRGPVNFVAGLSYERVNWLHRWVGRVLFLSATTHMAIMGSSISMQDILHSHDDGMTVVRYGIAAYAMLTWIAVSSVLPIRRWSHRAFYVNHWISTFGFLFIALQHVPSYARLPIYLGISIVGFDKFLVAWYFCGNNFSIRQPSRPSARYSRGGERAELKMGYPVKMTTPSILVSSLPSQTKSEATIIRISNIPFSWKPGQHIRLYIPALGRYEMHPFTPANCSVMQPPPLPPRKDVETVMGRHRNVKQPAPTSEMLLMIKEKKGFTQRLADYQKEWLERPCPNASNPSENLTAYVDGPFGNTPNWEEYESLVLVSSSSGISFTLSILDHLEQLCFTGTSMLQTKMIKFIWTTRHVDPHFESTVKDLLARYRSILAEMNIEINAEFHTTCLSSQIHAEMLQYDPFAHLRNSPYKPLSARPPLTIRHPDEIYEEWTREAEQMIPTDEDASPFIVGTAGYNAYDEYADDNSDDTHTLVDGESRRGSTSTWEADEEDPFSDRNVLTLNDDAYRPLPPPKTQARTTPAEKKDEGCTCAVIQHQRRKLVSSRPDPAAWVVQQSGVRPDMKSILETCIAVKGVENIMVGVCANEQVTRDVRSVVARAQFAFARGRRRSNVDIFCEAGF